MKDLDKIYNISPVWMQNILVSTYGIYWRWARFGGRYRKHEFRFRSREHFCHQNWLEYQKQKLSNLLKICVEQVPYYQNNWTHGEKRAALVGKLDEIPILGKAPIRESPGLFVRSDLSIYPRFAFHTSGTTGTPIVAYYTLDELRSTMALREVRSANWAGVSFKEPRATFSGRLVEPRPDRDNHIYRYNAAEKQVYFSAFHLKPSTAKYYIDALIKHHISWLTGYAVSYYLLAKFILEQNLNVPKIKAIITTSEKLTHEMRLVLEKAFKCKVFEEYSTVENALFANDCEYKNLHVSPDAGIVEILRPDGSLCDAGEVGEVVTTSFLRGYQPLIRYRLGDLAAWDPEPCPCGRSMPVIKEVIGRLEDLVTGPDGRQLVRFHGIFVDQPNVIEGQIIQEQLDRFTVKIVPGINFSSADITEIQQRMYQRLGADIDVTVKTVSSISRTASGKFQAVISKLN